MFSHRKLHCSFCGKDEDQVAKLVAGPKVYICDACVDTARRIMDESPDPPPQGVTPRSGWIGRWFQPH